MTNPSPDPDQKERYTLVGGRRVDLTKYVVQVRGQYIVDYAKIEQDDPALYKVIVAEEIDDNRRQREYVDEILSDK